MSRSIVLRHGDYRRCLRRVKPDLIFTSPPYNIGSKSPRIDGFRRHGKYDPKSYGAIRDYPDNLSEDVYQEEQVNFLIWCADHLQPNGVLVYNHKPRRKDGQMILPAEWFGRLKVKRRLTLMEEIQWDRGSTHNKCSKMIWQNSERLYVFRVVGGKYPLDNHRFNDVWRINRAPSNGHNAPFPIELATRVIELWSSPGMLVCDPYMGSGTTALAAQTLGRRFEGSEILEKYYQQAVTRLSIDTKEVA